MLYNKSDCICRNPNNSLKNIHFLSKKIETTILKDDTGYGLGMMDCHNAIAVFNINFCPECGRKLCNENNKIK